MKEEFITKKYFDTKFDDLSNRFDKFSDLMMESFAYLNVKINDVEQRLDQKIDQKIDALDSKLYTRFNELSIRIDDLAETKVSKLEHKALKNRAEALENTPKTA